LELEKHLNVDGRLQRVPLSVLEARVCFQTSPRRGILKLPVHFCRA